MWNQPLSCIWLGRDGAFTAISINDRSSHSEGRGVLATPKGEGMALAVPKRSPKARALATNGSPRT
jgi:hypothetical protein